MQLVWPVDDHLVFTQDTGIVFCKYGKRALVHIQKFTEIVAILYAVKGLRKFKILQISDARDIDLDDRWLKCEEDKTATSLCKIC